MPKTCCGMLVIGCVEWWLQCQKNCPGNIADYWEIDISIDQNIAYCNEIDIVLYQNIAYCREIDIFMDQNGAYCCGIDIRLTPETKPTPATLTLLAVGS